MKKPLSLVLTAALVTSLTVTASAAPGGPKAGPAAPASPALALAAAQMGATSAVPSSALPTASAYPELSQYTDLSAEELWNQFAQAEAYKKLYELQEKAIHQQLKLLEGPGALYYYASAGGDASAAYGQLLELQNQQYLLKTQKEQYEWQKKQAESYLKLTGAKMGKAELQYALYAGLLTPSGLSYEELYAQQYALQLQEQQLEMQKKNLEYQYQMGQLEESAFVSQYAAAVYQKETVKMQREQYDAELQNMIGVSGPGLGLPLLP